MTTLRDAVGEYLKLRRSLGFKLHETGKLLLTFVQFLEEQRSSYITAPLALAWAQQSSTVQPAEWARRLSVVRTFARHRSATDLRTQIPPPGLLPFQPKRARPYLYSAEEIRSLLRAALRMPYRYKRDKLRPQVFYCLLGLLSVSGLRLGEARNLELQDVDLEAAVLTIRGASSVKLAWCLCMLRPVRCWRTISPDVGAIGWDEWSPLICSSQTGAIDWMAERFIERSMRCLDRSACGAPRTVMALGCTTCGIGSRRTPSCAGTGPVRIPSDDFPSCLPTLAMCTSPTPSGIWKAPRNSCVKRCGG